MKIGNVEIYGIIYKITNKINKKCYIGQSIYKFNERYPRSGNGIERVYKLHLSLKQRGLKYNTHLLNSIEKYGFEAFETIEMYDIAFSREELNIKEKHYIQLFNCYKDGYNRTLGGDGKSGWIPSEETRKKILENRPNTKGKNNPFYGKTHTNEAKEKIRQSKLGRNNHNAKTIICITTGKIFDTVTDGAKYYNCYDTTIVRCCKGKLKSTGKLPDGTKLAWMYLDDFLDKCEFTKL